MLERTGYFDRWRFDYRLYRRHPVREGEWHPDRRADAPIELTNRISEVGIEGLTTDEKQKAADIDRSNAAMWST